MNEKCNTLYPRSFPLPKPGLGHTENAAKHKWMRQLIRCCSVFRRHSVVALNCNKNGIVKLEHKTRNHRQWKPETPAGNARPKIPGRGADTTQPKRRRIHRHDTTWIRVVTNKKRSRQKTNWQACGLWSIFLPNTPSAELAGWLDYTRIYSPIENSKTFWNELWRLWTYSVNTDRHPNILFGFQRTSSIRSGT